MGVKSKTEEKDQRKPPEDSPTKKDDKPLDPVLEARKRKFESNEIKMKEGIIRLKLNKEEKPKEDYPIEVKQKEVKSIIDKPKEELPRVDKSKDDHKLEKPKAHKEERIIRDTKPEQKVEVSRSTTPKPKEIIVEVAPATTTTDDKQIDDSVPDEFKELEKLLLGGDDHELDSKVEDIFSDEDSASDNEGRFKVKEHKGETKPPVISFTKLMNGEKREIRSEPLTNYAKKKDTRERSERDKPSSRSRALIVGKKEHIIQEKEKKKSPEKNTTSKSLAKQRISYRTERPPPTMDKRFERKIEIKIKNPSKYEKSGKSKVVARSEVASSSSSFERKIKIDDRIESEEEDVDDDDDDVEPEIVVENDSDDEYSNINEGKKQLKVLLKFKYL